MLDNLVHALSVLIDVGILGWYLLLLATIIIVVCLWLLVRFIQGVTILIGNLYKKQSIDKRVASLTVPFFVAIVSIWWVLSSLTSFLEGLPSQGLAGGFLLVGIIIFVPYLATIVCLPLGIVMVIAARHKGVPMWLAVAILLLGIVSLAVGWWTATTFFTPHYDG